MKNFHLPLPEETYAQLRAEAERVRAPATTLAREAIDLWLRDQWSKARHDAIAAYAAEMAATPLDLDPHLESAAIEHLRRTSHAICHQATTLDRAKLGKRIGAQSPAEPSSR